GRPVDCDIMHKAIRSVFRGFLPAGKHPKMVLSLELEPGAVDVNVHPTKKEVRYSKPQYVYQLIQKALEKNLILQSSLSPERFTNEDPANQLNFDSNTKQVSFPSHQFSNFNRHNEHSQSKETTIPQELLNKASYKQNFLEQEENPSGQHPTEELFPEDELNSFEHSKEHFLNIGEINIKQSPKAGSPQEAQISIRGNSSDFALFGSKFQAAGSITGSKELRNLYLGFLQSFLNELDERTLRENRGFHKQTQIFSGELHKPKVSRKKVPLSLLEEVWERDGWKCVYCGKHLLHPHLVKKVLKDAPDDWQSRLGKNNQLFKTHLFREHQASFDHYLAYSFNKALNKNTQNLFACCRSCNQEKSNSVNFEKWKPTKQSPWVEGQEVEIGKALTFNGGNKTAKYKIRLPQS
ncbi:MAG TPA: hypothetical protein V6C96_01795, partial [Vampirovibrionales bacterium]